MADIPAVAMAYRLAEDQNALLRRVRQAKALRESDQTRGAPVIHAAEVHRPGDVGHGSGTGAVVRP